MLPAPPASRARASLPLSPGHVQPRTSGAFEERRRAVCEPRAEGDESATVPPADLEGRGRRVPESLAGCRGCLDLVEAAELQVQDAGEGEDGGRIIDGPG